MATLRDLPPVDALAAQIDAPRALALAAARAVLAQRRNELKGGASEEVDLGERAREWARAATAPSLRRVLNATGVIVHTNLGRAPLSAAAREAVARAAHGYANLELDLETGERGSRHAHVEALLKELTGAEAGLAVNNGAGAALLAAAALAGPGREVIVSRGQLVEIGGGFRVPDVIAQAGARLVEVGTTNRTRLADYERALTPDTGAILRVHQSNFRQLGFVEDVAIEALCELGPPVIDDAGSGALAPLYDEPHVRRSIAAGAALVCFSGDKLLGGPQAGLLVGTDTAVEAARRHPLARALRIDKLSLAALEATLRRTATRATCRCWRCSRRRHSRSWRAPARGADPGRRDRASGREGRRRRAAAARAARTGGRAARGARRAAAPRRPAAAGPARGRPPPARPPHARR